ncbi:MAG: hypothetical protein EP307_02350 [Rhodobacteraceae bacterium]|nr:MAG: hypothetical protein EP307_02350 [Paracoccaceae bacterium]
MQAPSRDYTRLFELFRQDNLSQIVATREARAKVHPVDPDTAAEFLLRAQHSFSRPGPTAPR